MSIVADVKVQTAIQRGLQLLSMPDHAVVLERVSKEYEGGVFAVQDVSLTVPKAETLAVIGPNGAGKSTLIRLICGIVTPSSGRVLICGLDPQKESPSVRTRLCGLLQGVPIEQSMRVHEVLDLFAKFYRQPLPPSQLLELVGLAEKSKCTVRTLSGGQKQRLAIARALIGNPEILVLDEPTTGLDVAIRHELMDVVQRLKQAGRAIIVSTHYLEEAEQYCDRAAILCRGKLFALDTPEQLIRKFGSGDRLQVKLTGPFAHEQLQRLGSVSEVQPIHHDSLNPTYVLAGKSAEVMLKEVVISLAGTGVRLDEIRIIRSGLEGAYLNLTGEGISS